MNTSLAISRRHIPRSRIVLIVSLLSLALNVHGSLATDVDERTSPFDYGFTCVSTWQDSQPTNEICRDDELARRGYISYGGVGGGGLDNWTNSSQRSVVGVTFEADAQTTVTVTADLRQVRGYACLFIYEGDLSTGYRSCPQPQQSPPLDQALIASIAVDHNATLRAEVHVYSHWIQIVNSVDQLLSVGIVDKFSISTTQQNTKTDPYDYGILCDSSGSCRFSPNTSGSLRTGEANTWTFGAGAQGGISSAAVGGIFNVQGPGILEAIADVEVASGTICTVAYFGPSSNPYRGEASCLEGSTYQLEIPAGTHEVWIEVHLLSRFAASLTFLDLAQINAYSTEATVESLSYSMS